MGKEETELHNIPRAQVLQTVSQHTSSVIDVKKITDVSNWKIKWVM